MADRMEGPDGARTAVWEAVSGMSAEALHESAGDRWSVLQVLEHLYMTERTVTAGIRHVLTQGEAFAPKDKPMERTLDRSNRLQAPDGIDPKGNFHTLADAREHLDDSRRQFREVVEQTDEAGHFDDRGFQHPFFGRLSVAQWVEFLGLHERRHLEQIEEIKRGAQEA